MTTIRWLGHASTLMELGGVRLLTDPVLGGRIAHLTRRVPPPSPVGEVDVVLISHVHRDHLDLPSLALIAGSPQVVVPAGGSDLVRGRGFERVAELREGESIEVAGAWITATPARHRARRGPFSPWVPALGFVIEAHSRVYFAGDTEVFDSMAALAPLDVALLPVGGWGPRLGPGHLDPSTAAEALRLLRPRIAVPIHWGTFFPIHLRGRPPVDPPLEFARHAAVLAPEVEVRVLQPGEALTLD
jgi:L-ascorbate metabolism protein UlaG (beta-lactamase superfamily)